MPSGWGKSLAGLHFRVGLGFTCFLNMHKPPQPDVVSNDGLSGAGFSRMLPDRAREVGSQFPSVCRHCLTGLPSPHQGRFGMRGALNLRVVLAN